MKLEAYLMQIKAVGKPNYSPIFTISLQLETRDIVDIKKGKLEAF